MSNKKPTNRNILNFQIQSDSEVPASKQLFDQLQFAIASGQFARNHRLPSTRQLAMITGLHRNTISKVYQSLEETGLVRSVAGSGIYVKNGSEHLHIVSESPGTDSEYSYYVKESIDSLIEVGLNLDRIKELYTEEIDWRIQCNENVHVSVPENSINEGKVMQIELSEILGIPIELTPIEDLLQLCAEKNFGTIITNHYFIQEVANIVPSNSFRIIPVDIYDYSEELKVIKKLPENSCIGIVSLSKSILEIATSIVCSQIGDTILVLTAEARDNNKLLSLIKTANTIIVGPSSYEILANAIETIKQDLIRKPNVICSNNFINKKSIDNVKLQLDLII